MPYDSTNGEFSSRVDVHPLLGRIDYVHLPLETLHDYFPDVFRKLETYKSFSLLRDPHSRFASALGQWFKNTARARLLELSPEEIVAGAEQVIADLERHPNSLRPELIHFRAQWDYVMFDGGQVVKRLFRLETLSHSLSELGTYLGLELGAVGHDNAAPYYKSRVAKELIESCRKFFGPVWDVLPITLKQSIYAWIFSAPRLGTIPTVRGTKLTVIEILTEANLLPAIDALYSNDFGLLSRCEDSSM